jgi:hypothetical protein
MIIILVNTEAGGVAEAAGLPLGCRIVAVHADYGTL